MEVIYTGLHKTPEMIAEAALQEDVDVVGLSILSGAHMVLVPRTIQLRRENGQDNVIVVVGGIIPDEDVPALLELGVTGVYGPGTLTEDIIRDIHEALSIGLVVGGSITIPHLRRAVRAWVEMEEGARPAGTD